MSQCQSSMSGAFLSSYYSNDEEVQNLYALIKFILLDIAEIRGLNVDENETFDMDTVLNKIVEVPSELKDFNPLYFKSEEKLNKYIDDKTKNMTLDELNKFLEFFSYGGMCDSFRSYMVDYITGLMEKIDELHLESFGSSRLVDIDEEGFGNPKSNGEHEEYINQDDIFLDTDNKENADLDGRKTSDKNLIKYIKYINSFPQIIKYQSNARKIESKLIDLSNQKKLNEFYSNKSFTKEFEKIMSHDTKQHIYHFHGTQGLESADLIMQEGLGMTQNFLSSTSEREFTKDDVILYSRGFMNEIGRDAIVIIDQPRLKDGKPKTIVEPLQSDKKIHFVPSGLQGLDGEPRYIVDPQYIVGYVDKKNKTIIYNPRYYDYSRFNDSKDIDRPKGVPYSNERIADGVLNAHFEELIKTKEQEELQQ